MLLKKQSDEESVQKKDVPRTFNMMLICYDNLENPILSFRDLQINIE